MTLIQKVADRYLQAGEFLTPRNSYLPQVIRGLPPTFDQPEGTDLQIWTWEMAGKPYGIAFAGKSNKHIWFHRFSNEQQRDAHVKETITNRKSDMESKNKRREERKNFVHTLKVGDILYSSWGYDQTNIDFYQVTKVIGKAVEIREIGKSISESSGRGYDDEVMPVPNRFINPPMRKIPQDGYKGEPTIRLTSYSSASLWNGKPKYQTAAGYGH